MNETGPARRPVLLAWALPSALGASAAAAVLGLGGLSMVPAILALVFGLAGLASGWLLARPDRQTAVDEMAQFLEGQRAFCEKVTPVWAAQIDSSRAQMDSAVASLSARFSGIVDRLDVAVATASHATASVESQDKGLVAVFADSERELGAVVTSQRNAMHGMSTMLQQVHGLSQFTEQLHEMAGEVDKIATQCKLLSLNAAIEAAHAGERGRGFAIVAKEFRTLATQSGETGQRIGSLVDVISAAIKSTCAAAEASVRVEEGSASNAEARIGAVLEAFKNVTDALLDASRMLKDESVTIKSEVGEALVQLQFQDRVNQILSHVIENIQQLGPYVARHRDQCLASGALQSIDADGLLEELKKTYVMTDEHAAHQGRKADAPKGGDTDITFF